MEKKLPPILEKIIQTSRLKRYPKGQIMFYQGDSPLEVALLKSGFIKVYDIDEQGNEKILHIVNAGALVPFSFFSGTKNEIKWFYAALTDCDVYVLDIDRLKKMLMHDANVSWHLMHWFSSEVHEILVRLSSLGKTSAKRKICAALQFLAVTNSKPSSSDWRQVNFPVNHQLLADMTGVTRESAAMIMKELNADGFVRNPRQTVLEINTNKLDVQV